MVLCMLPCYSVRYFKAASKERKAQQELERVYGDIFDPDQDVARLLKRHGPAHSSAGLSSKEFAVLWEKFCTTFATGQTGEAGELRRGCAVCLDQYRCGDLVVCRPGSSDLSHRDCLGPWMQKEPGKPQSPLSKKLRPACMVLTVRRIDEQTGTQRSTKQHDRSPSRRCGAGSKLRAKKWSLRPHASLAKLCATVLPNRLGPVPRPG